MGQEPTKPRAIYFPNAREPATGSPGSRATALDTPVRLADITGMNYDEFTRSFLVTLRDSGLRPLRPEERIDLRSGSRMFAIGVEPLDEEVGKPFHVVASISFEWSALQAARSATCEEDLIAELLGGDEGVETERPLLRVDIKLQAGLPWGKGIPMPAATVWAKWNREALARLEKVEPLISEDAVRETPEGRLAILAWQGDPEAKITCNPLGELRLESLTVRAFQGIDLPRTWDDPEREPDEAPHAQLRAMFERVRAALYAWGEVMDTSGWADRSDATPTAGWVGFWAINDPPLEGSVSF